MIIYVNRGVTRLFHFTKLKSLIHILYDEDGILATDFIENDVKQQNDLSRLDKSTDYVCCSLQYPNTWYWKKLKERDEDKVFKEWVFLSVNLATLKERQFKFCPFNAATDYGIYIRDDVININEIFAPIVGNRVRQPNMLECCPTDGQAEILVCKNIPLKFINSIIVGNEICADNIGAILKTIDKDISVFISPDVCNTNWNRLVSNGQAPQEIKYDYRGE